nr:glycerophosphodiester phosphodiesterase [Streptomyces sp. ODS25]
MQRSNEGRPGPAQGTGTSERPGRRAVLGAAVLGAGGVVTAAPGAACAADRPAAADRGGFGSLPVPTVIGHRGTAGYRPEHTLGSYRLALELGAHIIEQDVVPTKDGHLVCRHENDISVTTDVADHPEFAGRRTTKTVDGKAITGWFTEDFTLAELKTLRAQERIPQNRPHNTLYNGRWEVPAYEEVLQWADREGKKRGRPVWLYVETKHPSYFRTLGYDLEELLVPSLRRHDRDHADAPQILQSFEPSSIHKLSRLVDTPGIVLLDAAGTRPWDFVEAGDPRTVDDLVKPEGLAWIASFARGIGPTLNLIIPRDAAGRLTTPTTLVRDAHAAGLILHPYTMRNENTFLPADFRKGTDPNAYGDAFGAFRSYFATGIDGVFTDNADTALLAREDFVNG